MRKFTTRDLTAAALIAAVYAALTLALPAFGAIQFRISEALTVLPFLFAPAAPGIVIGCLVANLLSPYGIIDIVCGTAATAIAAVWTSKLKNKWLAPMPPVVCNLVIIGGMIAWYEAGFTSAFPALFAANALSVGVSELVACYGLGMVLLLALPKIPYLRGRMVPERLS